MRVFTNVGDDLMFTFDSPITAFGADFRSINDEIVRTELDVDGETVVLPIAASTGLFSFFGVESDAAFTTVKFVGLANDVYGIDNVSYSPIPEPSTLALTALGLMALCCRRRRRT